MKFILKKLYQSKWLNITIAIVYYLLVTLPHEEVGLLTVKVFGHLSRDDYNGVILLLTLLGVGGYLAFVFSKTRKDFSAEKSTLIYLFTTLIFMVICFKMLMVVNIEMVHFIQYAGMAILLFPLIRRYGETLFWTTLLGALDEAWQYFYLAPQRTDYYDFNDVIINLVGGALGLIIVRLVQPYFTLGKNQWKKSTVFYAIVVLSVSLFIALQMNWLYVFPPIDDPQAFWSLVRKPIETFWVTVHPNVTYHVVQPMEGVLVIGGLLLFYIGLRKD